MAKVVNIEDAKTEQDKAPVKAEEPKDIIDQNKVKNVKKLYRETENALKKTYEKMVDLGTALLDLRQDVKHGSFMKLCTEDMGLNYKACQRAMLIAEYRPQIEADVEGATEDAASALKLANKLKKQETDERNAREEIMFKDHLVAEKAYEAETAELDNATDIANVPKPEPAWKGDDDSRNIFNRYKAWKKKQEAAEDAGVGDAELPPPTIDEVVEAAYQSALLKLDPLGPEDMETALALLVERLSSIGGVSEFPETHEE